jgi:hypothetical protein
VSRNGGISSLQLRDMARNYFEIRNEAGDRNTYKVTIASSQHFSLFDIRNSETDISRITI